jgi:DNA-binding FadR family transcriptional regulator
MPERGQSHDYAAADQRRSHTARVIRELGTAIVAGKFPQNSLLPGDAELTERFKVSRTVLREATKTLAGKGLIQAKARIGTRVRPRSEWNLFDPDVLIWHVASGVEPDFLLHLSEMRIALEPEAAALAAERRTREQLAEIQRWAEAMGAPGITAEEFVRADLALHLAVAAAAANPFLRSISTLIEVALVAVLTVSQPVRDPLRLARSVAQHRAVADAIAGHDAEGARTAMRAVIAEGLDQVREKVGEPGKRRG